MNLNKVYRVALYWKAHFKKRKKKRRRIRLLNDKLIAYIFLLYKDSKD